MSKAQTNFEAFGRELDSMKSAINKQKSEEEAQQIGIITNCIFTIAQILEFFNY